MITLILFDFDFEWRLYDLLLLITLFMLCFTACWYVSLVFDLI